jgi:hypothetical protein
MGKTDMDQKTLRTLSQSDRAQLSPFLCRQIYRHTEIPIYKTSELRSTDRVNRRAVLSRARPRYRLYSRHRDIGGISPVPDR